jgi:predicted DNA-binding antitoxin AbrB/MazE fold protein
MAQFFAETSIKNGGITLRKIPLKENTKVQVVLIPKADLSSMSFATARKLTKKIKGNLSEDIIAERNKR